MTQRARTAGTVRRVAIASAAALTVAAVASGCDDGTTRPAAAPPQSSPSATPKEALVAAVPDGTEGTFRFSGKDSSSVISGLVDPESKAMELITAIPADKDGIETKMSFLVIDEKLWMKAKFTGRPGLPRFPDKWMELDRAKLHDGDGAPTYEGADPGNAGPLLDAATAVQAQGGGRYAGTIDLTSGEAAKVLEAEQMTALGAAAGRVPFTAVVGPDGNLASLTMEVPAAGKQKAFTYVVKYADYGTAPKLSRPTGSKATKAPAMAYEMLNS